MENSRALVSVIVPTYNHVEFVIQALDSVYEQSLNDIELIIIDDCSSDNTYGKALQWAKVKKDRFNRLEIRRNARNSGAHATINAGLDMAQGAYLSILNSDDWYAPERLERMLRVLKEKNGGYAFSNVTVVDEDGNILKKDPLAIDCITLEDQLSAYPSPGFALLKKNIAITTGNILFSRSLQKKVGYFNDLKLIHDWDFLIRCLAYEEPIYVPDELYYYRVYKGNSFKKLKAESFLESHALMRKYFKIIENRQYENLIFPIYKNFNNLDLLSLMAIHVGEQKINCLSLTSSYQTYKDKNI